MKFALMMVLALAACSDRTLTQRPDEVPAADLAGRFEQIAFFNEFKNEETPLQRFETDIRVAPIYHDTARYQDFVSDLATMIVEIGALSGRPIRTDRERPNFILFMRDRAGNVESAMADVARFPDMQDPAGYVDLARNWICGGKIFFNDDSQIQTAIIFLPVDLDDEMMRICIVQEMAQALGLLNDIDDPHGSVFSSRSRRTTLSKTDRKLIQILYDDRLYSGMTRFEAMPIVREIIAEKGW